MDRPPTEGSINVSSARHCRICGSRRIRPSVRSATSGHAPTLFLRCRDCRARIAVTSPSQARMWQRRRPLATWLFSGGI